MKKHSKFLEFNGNQILFLSVKGMYWISLPSICKALNIDANRSYKNAKRDPIIGPALAIQPMQVPGKGGIQLRNVTCIPEHLIYGWLFSVQSDTPELTEYKRTCYQLLYNHFHGRIGNRRELLLERKELDTQINQLKEELNADEKFKQLQDLQDERKSLVTRLSYIDKEMVNQTNIFD